MSDDAFTPPSQARLSAAQITVGYGSKTVIPSLDLDIHAGEFVAIVGPNGCGKSTLLKTFGRVLRPTQGQVTLDGRALSQWRGRDIARRVALLAQSAHAPEGITVAELVARGRHPHHTVLRQWSSDDDAAIADALARTAMTDLATARVASLSGGQRQRAWVAMVLAQDTNIMLLDEPTTFLDLAHQYELLDLVADLHAEGRTVVAVLHDLNQAARYASRMVVLNHGRIVVDGAPVDVLTEDLIREVFGLAADVVADPRSNTPMIVPHLRATATASANAHGRLSNTESVDATG